MRNLLIIKKIYQAALLCALLVLSGAAVHAGPANVTVSYDPVTHVISASWDVLAGSQWYNWGFGPNPSWCCANEISGGATANGSQNTASFTYTLNEGNYIFAVEACDPVNCLTNDYSYGYLTYDVTAPTCSVTALSAYQNFETFTVSWSGSDNAAGIANYSIQVSDNSGSWTDWQTNVTTTSASYVGVDLHNYAFRCKAIDNKANESTYPGTANTSTTVDAIIGTTITGLVDGASGSDISYQTTNSSISAHWNEVITDSLHQYAVGTTSGGTDIVTWTALLNGGSPINAANFTVSGLSLSDGTTYYFSIRTASTTGRTGTPYTTDGVTVDATGPTCSFSGYTCTYPTNVTLGVITSDAASGVASYDTETQMNTDGWVSWESGINSVYVYYDTTSSPTANYSFRCRATDNAGNVGDWSPTHTLTVDADGPAFAYVNDGGGADVDYTNVASQLSANWSTTEVGCYGLAQYLYRIGTTPGGNDVVVDWNNNTVSSVTRTGLALTNGVTYYFKITARDNANNYSYITSDGIMVDTQPPTPSFTTPSSAYVGTTSFNIEWTATDAESGNADNYNIQYRQDGGAWTDYWGGSLPTTDTFSTFTGVDASTYDFRITAQDNAGNWSSYPVSPDYNLRVTIYSSRPDAPANVYDGTTTGTDVDITASNSGFSASWDAVTVTGGAVYSYAIGTTSGGTDIVNWTDTTDTYFDLATATYSDGNYYVSVQTKNISGLTSLAPTTSDGILIDTTAPTCTVTALDAWQVFSSSFAVQWSGTDGGSGIASYDVQNQDNSGGWVDWQTGNTGTSATLNGTNGHSYDFQCRATDNAGNTGTYPGSAQTSTSIDTSGPTLSYAYDGTGADESYTISGNTLSANWAGADPESGIQRYEYAVGTTSGGSDILSFTSVNTNTSVTNSSLSLSNATTYYITVRAYNNAGLASDLTTNGILADLAAPTTSMSKPSSAYTSTANFNVVWSGSDGAGESGLNQYLVQYKENTGAWTDWAPSPTTDTSRTFNGATGNTYYFRVVASDIAGNTGSYPVSPDYQATTIVDTTLLPAPDNIYDGVTSGTDVDFTTTTDSLSAYWDAVTDAVEYRYSVGTTSGGQDIVAQTTTTDTSFTAAGLSLMDATKYYVTVQAKNISGIWGAEGTSDGITIDLTAPTCTVAALDEWQSMSSSFAVSWSGTEATSGIAGYDVQVQNDGGVWSDWQTGVTITSDFYSGAGGGMYGFRCRASDNVGNISEYPADAQASTSVDTTAPEVSYIYDGTGADESLTNTGDTLGANWAASDPESGIERYEYAIGTSAGGSDLVDWTINGTNTSIELTSLSLRNAVTYYVSVRAYNSSGLYTELTTDGILSDIQPPVAQFTAPTSDYVGSETFTVAWEGSDGNGESGLKEYTLQYKEENGQWADWSPSPTTDTSRQFTGVDQHTYNFRIIAEDNAGNLGAYPVSPDYQLSVGIDLTKPSAPGRVYDGTEAGDDDYTSVSTSFSGHWDAVEGAAEYAYAVGTIAGETNIIPWTNTTETSFTKTGLTLTSGQKYFLAVRMKNNLGVWSSAAVSDGIIVDTSAPTTPVVKDEGDITSDASNLKFTLETSDKETPLTKIEYAIGTDPAKTDVRDWTNIGLQTSLTASKLSLDPGTRYYILVRAENAAGLVSKTGASNGINRVVGSLISFSYLPLEITVQTGSDQDVMAPIEMIIKESGGSKVIYTQLKRTFSLPGGMVIEDPVIFTTLTVNANEEQRVKTTVAIPGRIVQVAMGGVTRAKVNVTLNYIGTDSGGNAVSSMFQIPVTLTSADSGEAFALGDLKITSPQAGQFVGDTATVTANVTASGVGTLKWQWILNGNSTEVYDMAVNESGTFELSKGFSPLLEGDNKIVLRITSPEFRESDTLKFRGTSSTAVKVSELWAGAEKISEANVKYDVSKKTYTGTGKLKLPFSDTLIEIPLKNVSVKKQDGKTVISGAVLSEPQNYKITRGPVTIQATTLLLSSKGLSADGKIMITSTDGVPGIGPLYFYGVNITDKGIEGEVTLESPQKGKLGVFKMTIDGLTFFLNSTGAKVKTTGNLAVSGQQVSLRKDMVIETTPDGGLRFGKP